MPSSGIWDSNLGSAFYDSWKVLTGGDVDFLVPALLPFKTSLVDARGFALVPMSTPAWQRTLQQLVLLAPSEWGVRSGELPTT